MPKVVSESEKKVIWNFSIPRELKEAMESKLWKTRVNHNKWLAAIIRICLGRNWTNEQRQIFVRQLDDIAREAIELMNVVGEADTHSLKDYIDEPKDGDNNG